MAIDSKIAFADSQDGILLPSEHPLQVDEKAWTLIEREDPTPDGLRLDRVQAVRVHRGRRVVEFARVMGPASQFPNGPFLILALDTESVGRIMDRADLLRRDNGLQRAMDDHAAEFDPIQQAVRRAEQMREYVKRNRRTVRNLRK